MKTVLKKQHTLLTLIGVFLVGFIGYTVRDSIIGAPLSVRMVKNGSVVAQSYLPITGTAPHARALHINGRPVSIDSEGNFSDGIILSLGQNIVTINQEDKFGNEKEKVVHLIAKQSDETAGTVTVYYQNE